MELIGRGGHNPYDGSGAGVESPEYGEGICHGNGIKDALPFYMSPALNGRGLSPSSGKGFGDSRGDGEGTGYGSGIADDYTCVGSGEGYAAGWSVLL